MEKIQQQKRKLTKKQKGFVKDYVIDENGTQAVLKNYDVKKNITAANIATENLSKPYIVEAIENKRKSLKEALFEEGINEQYIAQKVNVLLKATDNQGNPDINAIDKGLKHTLSIHGVEEPNDKPKSQTTYNFIFNAETQAEIKELEDKIKARLIQKHV